MKTMRQYKSLLTAVMVAVLGLGMGSCADNIDNSTTPSDNPQEQQAAEEKAEKYWAIVSHLVDVDDYTDDYEDMTFEPVYGVEGSEAGTRYVYTNTAAAAAERFADLVDVKEGIDENTETFTYSDADVGTLIYKKGTGRVLATVDVSIKQIPGLKKIVYVPGAYANGTFTGRAYYRFGDVVSRRVQGYPNGEVTEYWICVRPSFGREGKGDSHWVCLNVLPKKNVEFYHSNTNSKDYYMPKGLGTNEEQMQNLAELLYAIYFPEQWQANVRDLANNPSLKMFHDFDRNLADFHNQFFWTHVQNGWKDKDILKLALNFSGDDDDLREVLNDGLHLLYKGYSWWWKSSWNCSLYEAIYKNGERNSQKNMHQTTTHEQKRNMMELNLDCRKMGEDNWTNYATFFDTDGKFRWTVRHATGKELAADGRYDKKAAINGVTEVYRYYRDVLNTNNLNLDAEVTEDLTVVPNAINGRGAYMIGDVVRDEYDNRWICISGTSVSATNPGATDSLATFVSFDFNEVDKHGSTIAGLPTEEEIPELAYRMLHFMSTLQQRADQFQYAAGASGRLGIIGQHILDYAHVDLEKISVTVDSTFRFTSKNSVYYSDSRTNILNIAYNDGSNRQAVIRAILDNTMAGTERNSCETAAGVPYKDFFFRLYKHYETFDLNRMQAATNDERELGINHWCRTWVMTQDKMYLQDVANQEMVNRYAKTDKWATLPLSEVALAHYGGPRRPSRTQAEPSANPRDYIGIYDRDDAQKTNMFNEPVCFLRVMKVKDFNNRRLNLVSEDGRHLSVEHLLNNYTLYDQAVQSSWAILYSSLCKVVVRLDNVKYEIQPVKGLEYMADMVN